MPEGAPEWEGGDYGENEAPIHYSYQECMILVSF